MRSKSFLTATWVSLLLAGAAHGQPPDGSPQGPPARVRVAVVGAEALQPRTVIVARLRQVASSTVAAEQPGRVVELAVDEGDVVAKGDVLARIDADLARTAVDHAQAALKMAEAGIAESKAVANQAEREYRSLLALQQRGSSRTKEVEDAMDDREAARARYESAVANVAAARADLKLARQRLDRMTVRAPFEGVVVRRMTELGQWVEEGTSVFTVNSRGPIDAVADVPERLVNHVRRGDAIEIVVDALGDVVEGRIVAIVPLASESARTFPVKVRFDDTDGRYKPGMSALARLPIGERRETLLVPRSAVQHSATGMVVWAEREGRAEPAPVRIMFGHGEQYAVAPMRPGQLIKGMNVVIEGAERLFPGQPLSY